MKAGVSWLFHFKWSINTLCLINQIIRNTFLEYCSTTTIHGIPYLTERKRHWTEKCFWAIVLGLSVWTCGSMIRDIWIKWRDYPTTMSLTEEPLPISTIPFPTVTVCPRVKTLKEKLDLTSLFGLPADLWNLSDVEYDEAITKKLWNGILNEFISDRLGWK